MTDDSQRHAALTHVADVLIARRSGHPLRVAVDGITAAGKSTFAAEVTAAAADHGVPTLHLSTDDYHHVAAHRRRDADPALGYYRDAYDLDAFRQHVLQPLGPEGDRSFRRRWHDLESDELLDEPLETAADDSVIVVDGSFLQTKALRGSWDVVIWLDTSFDAALERAVPRDTALFGGSDAVRRAYATRYHPACRLYLSEWDPRESATVVVSNDDLEHPVITWRL